LPTKIDNINNNASTILHTSRSDLSRAVFLDDTTHLSATLAQSTSSRISHSRYLPICQADGESDDNDDELDQLVASTFTPLMITNDENDEQQQQQLQRLQKQQQQQQQELSSSLSSSSSAAAVSGKVLAARVSTESQLHYTNQRKLCSIRNFVRQAIHSCRENLTLVDQLLEHIPASSYEHVLQRKVRRIDCIMNMPNSIKGLQYYPSTSVQTEQ
jgi:hypothetical protein